MCDKTLQSKVGRGGDSARPMDSPHHNVFWYYRGPTRGDATEELRLHRQVEDNTTKALINALEHADREVLASFIRRFISSDWTVKDGTSRFYLQRGPDRSPTNPRVLLGISPQGDIESASGADPSESPGRIDAAIEPAGGGLVVIEVKTAGELDGAQLRRHATRWSIEPPADDGGISPPDTWRLLRWADVWRWARDEHGRASGEVSRFLLDQLTEYLAALGLAPWSGFQLQDFEVFRHGSYETRAGVKNRLSGLWERVLERLDPEDRARLGTIHVGRFGPSADTAWAQTNRGEDGVNLTLELNATELQLNLVAWNKALARRLEQWLERRQGPRLPLELVVHERHAPTAGGRPNWRAATHTPPVARFSPDEVTSGAFALWREQWAEQHDERLSALAYHLRQRWSRQEVLGRAEGIALEVTEDVQRLLPLLREINRWD